MKIRYKCGYDENGAWFCKPIEQYYAEQQAKLNIILDEMEPTVHPCDQRVYTSKGAFREVSRAHGKEEIGNEYDAFVRTMKPDLKREPFSATIKKSWDFLEAAQGRPESERREMEERYFSR